MYPKTNLTPGSSGNDVTQLQKFLISQGFNIPAGATGYYGDQTKAAVTQWQSKNGVQAGADAGYWGPKSISAASGRIDVQPAGLPIGGQRNLQIGQSTATAPVAKTTPTVVNQPQTIAEIEKYINDVVDSVVASGKTINPDITQKELEAIDPDAFLKQAEASIAPEYAGKFASIKEGLSRTLSDIGYDLNLKKQDISRTAEQALETGTETMADRGLAFSGNRQKFETQLEEQKQRGLTAEDISAGRLTQEAVTGAESKIGTENVRNLGFATPGIVPQYSSTPLVGSLTSERQYLKESTAKELQRQEAERRAYSTRNLSFS